MSKKELEKIYLKKINQLIEYDEAYFKKDEPIVSDKDYDYLKEEIIKLEKKYSHLASNKSPSKKIGFTPSNKFKKIKH